MLENRYLYSKSRSVFHLIKPLKLKVFFAILDPSTEEDLMPKAQNIAADFFGSARHAYDVAAQNLKYAVKPIAMSLVGTGFALNVLSGCKGDDPINPGGGTKPTEVTTVNSIGSDIDVIKADAEKNTITIYGGDTPNKFYTTYSMNADAVGPKVKIKFKNADLESLNASNGAITGHFSNWKSLETEIRSASSDITAYSKDGTQKTPVIINTTVYSDPIFYNFQDNAKVTEFWNKVKDPNSNITFTEVTESSKFQLKSANKDWSLQKPANQ